MTDYILHHYAVSPVSEKIRVVMGIKQLGWHSVEHNRLPDRPELLAMTGGYRRIPVLQIGADIYCDTQCILRELDRRVPQPTLFPNDGAGLPFALSRWTDGAVFNLAVRLAFALNAQANNVSEELLADRGRLILGPGGDFRNEIKNIPHILAQLRAQLGWLETRLGTGRQFVLGDAPGMPDALAYYLVWFIRGRYHDAENFFSQFPLINAWAQRVEAIGHGTPTPMTPQQSLEIASAATTTTDPFDDPSDPQGLQPGMTVAVSALYDSGEIPIQGVIHAVDADTVVLTRNDPACGDVAVHFPRVGYQINAV